MRTRHLGALVAVLGMLAVAACGSTVNRPTQVATEVDGGSGRTATTDVVATDGGATTGGTGEATTGGTGPASGGTTGGATATTAPPAAGGPVKTGPIEIGFMISRASNAAAFGGSLPEKVDQPDIYNALVRAQNKKGGIHGRPIVPVFAETDSASNNFDADLAAACSTFVEDHKVEAVIGRISDLTDPLETCLNKRQIPHIAATPEGRDDKYLAQYPYLFNTMSLSLEQRTRVKVDYAVASGIFKPSDKIGVLFAGCPAELRSWDQDALPYFKSKGLNVASVFYTRCPQGASDAITEVGKIGNVLLQFRSAGVNKVYFHAAELAALFIMANAAEAQGYRPTYFVSSLANTAVSGTQIPAEQKPNVLGIGWSPASDVQKAQWPAPNPAAASCLVGLRAEGITPQTPLDNINAFIMCDTMSLFVAAADAAGGRVDGPSIAAAIRGIGTKQQNAYSYDGTSHYGPGRQSGIASAYPYGWNAGCACYRYSGGRIAIP
jgi:ABC-type branched-subunit amino acid transport system substrate-binding protein